MSMMKNLALTLGVLATTAGTASAAGMYTFEIDQPVNGDVPKGTALATIADLAPDKVQITMDLRGLTQTSEFVNAWLFNYNGGAGALSTSNFTFVSSSPGTVQAVSINFGNQNGGNNVKAGLFDIDFEFATSNQGNRFYAGNVVVYNVTATGLTAAMFLKKSTADGNNPGGYYSALHVQGIDGGGKSGSLGAPDFGAVPEPTSIVMMGLGAVGLIGVAARRRKARSA